MICHGDCSGIGQFILRTGDELVKTIVGAKDKLILKPVNLFLTIGNGGRLTCYMMVTCIYLVVWCDVRLVCGWYSNTIHKFHGDQCSGSELRSFGKLSHASLL